MTPPTATLMAPVFLVGFPVVLIADAPYSSTGNGDGFA